MPENLAAYIDKVLSKGASGGLRNPLMKMPVKRFRQISPGDYATINDGKVWTVGTLEDPIARNLWKNYQEKIRERGEHTAYLTYGTVELTLAGTAMSGAARTALMPIWLKRAELQQKDDRVIVKIDEDERWAKNQELAAPLQQLGIDWSSRTAPGDQIAYNSWLAAQLSNRGKVAPAESYLGCFSSQHLVIREKIKDGRWRRAFAQNNVVRARFSDHGTKPFHDEANANDAGIEGLGLVLPVDDSQLRVVQLADSGRSLIVQGPPGTGKSQTITNLIANAWWKGKRVLLVCDKRTAIRQVEERLQKVGLGQALLNLHDEGLEKKEFLAQATTRFASRTGAAGRYPFGDLANLRKLLNSRVEQGEAIVHSALGIKRREALQGMIGLRNRLVNIPTLDIPNWTSLSKERLGRLFAGISEWEALPDVVADSENAWNALVAESFRSDPNARHEIETNAKKLKQLIARVEILPEESAPLGYITEFKGVKEIESLIDLADLVSSKPSAHSLIVGDSSLSLKHLADLKVAFDCLRKLEEENLPVDLAAVPTSLERQNIQDLAKAESVTTWDELQKACATKTAHLEKLRSSDSQYASLCLANALHRQKKLAERRGQIAMIETLSKLGIGIPTDWWSVSKTSPVSTVLRWEKEMVSLASHAKDSPYPVDLQAITRVSDDAWKHIEAKAEDGFNFFSYCVRFVNDRKVKSALTQIYPGISKGGEIPWNTLVLHLLKAREIIRQLSTTASLHPVLVDFTGGYLAEARTNPKVESVLASEALAILRTAASETESMRLRTDLFHLDNPVWTSFWASPGKQKMQAIEACRDTLLDTSLPDSTTDDISENIKWFERRLTDIETNLRLFIKNPKGITHSITRSFEAQNEFAIATTKLRELDRYAVLGLADQSNPDWDGLCSAIAWRDTYVKKRGSLKIDIDSAAWPKVRQTAHELIGGFKTCLSYLSRFLRGANEWAKDYSVLCRKISQIIDGLPDADKWAAKSDWNGKIAALPEIQPFWSRVVSGETKTDEARFLFGYNLLRLAAPPVEPNGPELSAKLRTFIQQDSQLDQWSVEALCDKLGEVQLGAMERFSQQNGELHRLSRLQRIRGTVREICDAHLDFLLAAKPGWLMSPISLANLIDLGRLPEGKPMFDLVIFDEASQVQVLEGILAMGFASQTIIVGDDKQLPPSAFFTSLQTDTDDDGMGDSESLLDEFQGVVSSAMLMAHYRSETPDLISFSNRKFYNGKLEMYPPAKIAGTGRVLRRVPNGVFDSGASRKNLHEAKVVVELVEEHVRKYSKCSLGVIAMNIEQMDLIEELLLQASAPVRQFCSDEERFFVRNLETVQGDEMDRIILSLTYAKSPDRGFNAAILGPLIKSGGHRRLNVALSRSKTGMTIVSSMSAAELALSNAQSFGFQCLKELVTELEASDKDRTFGITQQRFAKRIDGISELVFCESPFEEQVVEFLENYGCEIRCQVGAGDGNRFRIDLVVVENDQPILAVECDGAAYHSSRSARTRDRARQRQLEKLGWRFHRVWSTNWWAYPDAEKQALIQAIQEARRAVEG
jgi:very-short-patch-repair endonuclease